MRQLICFALLVLVACAPGTQEFSPDILGTWTYQLVENSNPDTTYDEGSFVARGSVKSGDLVFTNFYNVDYEGQYSVNEADKSVHLLLSDIKIDGHFINPDTLRGTWVGNDTEGTWEAKRRK